jgi:LemA protein
MRNRIAMVLACIALLALQGCGYNTLQSQDQQVKAAWGEVVNQYQRRADLIPNLVNTVKGYAAQEQQVLIGVTEARAKATSIQATPELVDNPEAFARFQAAQREVTGALSRLLVVAENYPQLKSDQNFRDLQAQLEGTENRIAVARNRFIKAVQEFNTTVRSFPSNLTAMVFGMKEKPQFTVDNEREIAKPPTVDFGTAAPTRDRATSPRSAPPPATSGEYPVPGK